MHQGDKSTQFVGRGLFKDTMSQSMRDLTALSSKFEDWTQRQETSELEKRAMARDIEQHTLSKTYNQQHARVSAPSHQRV